MLNNVILDKDTPRDVREQLRNSFIGFVLGGTFGSYRAGQDNYNQVQAQQVADWQAVADYMTQDNVIRRDAGEVGIGQSDPRGLSEYSSGVTTDAALLFDPAKQARIETQSIIKKMLDNMPSLMTMDPVASLTGKEFPKSNMKLTEQVGAFFNSLGNKVTRKGFGDVVVDEAGVQSDIAHGLGRAKSVTFAAVPNVIAKGKQIDYQTNWKGRGYDSFIFSAPISIDGQKAFVSVVVLKDSRNRFYLHEVVDGTGNRIYIKNEEPSAFKTGVTAQDGVTSSADSSFDPTVAKRKQNVNIQFAQSPAAQLQTIPGTDITYTLDEQSGEPEIKFSKPIEEMTPEEFERVLEMAESGGLMTDTDTHTPEMQKIIADYRMAVENDLVDYIAKARQNPNSKWLKYSFGEVDNRTAEDIKSLTGIDVSGFESVLRPNSVDHIDKRHGINGSADHSMADVNDIARIRYVMRNYDDVELLDDVSIEHKDKNNQPSPELRFSKRINGTYYLIEAVPDNSRKNLQIVSAYIESAKSRNKKEASQVLSAGFHPAKPTSETVLRNASFIPTIAQRFQSVNSQSATPQTVPGTNITYTLDEQSGEPQIRFSKPIEEMTPEEFERVLEMAEHGGLEVE